MRIFPGERPVLARLYALIFGGSVLQQMQGSSQETHHERQPRQDPISPCPAGRLGILGSRPIGPAPAAPLPSAHRRAGDPLPFAGGLGAVRAGNPARELACRRSAGPVAPSRCPLATDRPRAGRGLAATARGDLPGGRSARLLLRRDVDPAAGRGERRSHRLRGAGPVPTLGGSGARRTRSRGGRDLRLGTDVSAAGNARRRGDRSAR